MATAVGTASQPLKAGCLTRLFVLFRSGANGVEKQVGHYMAVDRFLQSTSIHHVAMLLAVPWDGASAPSNSLVPAGLDSDLP